jgi:TonB family protein
MVTPPTTIPPLRGQLFAADDLDVVPPACKKCPPPDTGAAERLGLQGDVVLDILVDENGHVTVPNVLAVRVTPDTRRDLATNLALDTVRKRQYEPATKGGVKGKFHITVTIQFQFRSAR